MKPKNFPARKAARRLAAKERIPVNELDQALFDAERAIRTKKNRGNRGRPKAHG